MRSISILFMFLFGPVQGFGEAPVVLVNRTALLTFLEQRNLIIHEAVSLRADWFKRVAERMDSDDDLSADARAVPELYKFYLMFIQAEHQLSFDDLNSVEKIVKEGPDQIRVLRAAYERTYQLAKLSGEEKGENLFRTPKRDGEHERRLLEQAQRRFASASAQVESLRVAETLARAPLERARARRSQFPEALAELFDRPPGAPLINRFGYIYSSTDWAGATLVTKPATLLERLRSRCSGLLRSLGSDH